MSNYKFSHLLKPGRIGQMVIKNRLFMPPMESSLATNDGRVTQELLDYYEERAAGGVGLIIVEACSVDFKRGKLIFQNLSIDDDRYIKGLSKLARVIQKHGAKAAIQIHHAGNATRRDVIGMQPLAPSPIGREGFDVPRAMTIGEIEDTIERFGDAAVRAKAAGFDGIEVHGAHHYLIAQFLSSAWNQRKDSYGGSLENRARFALETVRTIRENVGPSFPFWLRINGEEVDRPSGTTVDEAQIVAKMLEEAGVDAINVSAQISLKVVGHISIRPPGWGAKYCTTIKEVIKTIPVMACGALSPELGEELLAANKADFIGMGKALRADPELPNKLAEGCEDDIVPCIICYACYARFRPNRVRTCAVNPAIGREREYKLTPSDHPKRVMVIGAGPAGMEAARVAALRGHRVTLFEKEDHLGGQLRYASVPPYKQEIEKLNTYLINQVSRSNIEVNTSTEVTPSMIKTLRPDAAIVATGVDPIIPPIPGIDQAHVTMAEAILVNPQQAGQKVVVLGGGQTGCEVAAFFAEKNKQVTIIEMQDKLAPDMLERQGRQELIDILVKQGVTLLTQAKGEEINATGLVISDSGGNRRQIEADTIVIACGTRSNNRIVEEVKKVVSEVHVIGDCVRPRSILDAMDDAAKIGRAL